MKTLIIACLLALGSMAVSAEETPLDAVKKMIQGANNREIVRVDPETVGMTAEQIVQLLNAVDFDKAVFVTWGNPKEQWWKPEEDENFQLRMANPMCIGFEVKFVPDKEDESKGHYEVVKIQL